MIYGLLTPWQLLAKQNEPISRKLLDGLTEVQKYRPYFIEPFQPRQGIQLAAESLGLYISII